MLNNENLWNGKFFSKNTQIELFLLKICTSALPPPSYCSWKIISVVISRFYEGISILFKYSHVKRYMFENCPILLQMKTTSHVLSRTLSWNFWNDKLTYGQINGFANKNCASFATHPSSRNASPYLEIYQSLKDEI